MKVVILLFFGLASKVEASHPRSVVHHGQDRRGSGSCPEGDIQCKREAEECRRICVERKAPLMAKCTALAAFTGPLVARGLRMEGYRNVGAVLGATLAGLSPYCEGVDACHHCPEGRGLRDLVTEIDVIYRKSRGQMSQVEAALQGFNEQMADLDHKVKLEMDEVTFEIGLSNVFMQSWLDLAAFEAVYEHVASEQPGVQKLLAMLIARPKTAAAIVELESTFFQMIAGSSSYFRLSPSKFCNLRTVTALHLAQTRVREIFVFQAITSDPSVDPGLLLADFQAHQVEQNQAINRACGTMEPIQPSTSTPKPPSPPPLPNRIRKDQRRENLAANFHQTAMSRFREDPFPPHTTYDERALNEKCREICEYKVNELSVLCEALGVFGASLMCATVIFSPVLGCTFGSAISTKSTLAALCASGIFIRSCELCGEALSFDDILEHIDTFTGNATSSLRNGTEALSLSVDTLRVDFLSSLAKLRQFHHVTRAYGQLMSKVNHLDTMFQRLKRDRFGRPVRDRNFDKFFHENTLLSLFEAITEFHLLLVGSHKYSPFEVKSLFEIDSDYCQPDHVCLLENTHFGLIEKLLLVSNQLEFPMDEIKFILRTWRRREQYHISWICRS